MADALRFGAVVCGVVGMAWLALALPVHWEQVRGPGPRAPGVVRGLRALGAGALGLSLLLCVSVDHLSMAPLVWVMSLTASALVVALTLAWRPRWLAWLVAWVR